MNFWCRVLGHDYVYFNDADFRYRNCKRCNNVHEILGETEGKMVRDMEISLINFNKTLGNMIARMNSSEAEPVEDPNYTSKW
jgi:hypothetical protein